MRNVHFSKDDFPHLFACGNLFIGDGPDPDPDDQIDANATGKFDESLSFLL